jgi:hypothetical protein
MLGILGASQLHFFSHFEYVPIIARSSAVVKYFFFFNDLGYLQYAVGVPRRGRHLSFLGSSPKTSVYKGVLWSSLALLLSLNHYHKYATL